jgi:hypothetical protein
MVLRPVEYNGMIQNTSEVTSQKTQEDNKNSTLQSAMQQTAFIKQNESTTQVHGNTQTETENLQDDDENGTVYQRNNAKKRKKKEEKKKDAGKIHKKGDPMPFDIRI